MPVDIAFLTGPTVIGIILTGVVGNLLTLFVFIRYDPLRDVTGMFLANLAAADLLQSIIGMPLIATSAFREEWIFGDTLCTLSGMSNSLFCITSVLTLTAVSVDRYLAIVHPFEYQIWLTIKRAKLVLLCIWLQALVAALLPVFGWSRYVYLPYEFICTVQWEYDKAYTIFVWFICFMAPLIVTVTCYTGIMKVAFHQARDKPATAVGRISEAEQIPDASGAAVGDGKNPRNAKENLGFIAEDKNNSDKLESNISEATIIQCRESETTAAEGLSRDVIDQTRVRDKRGNVPRKSKASMSLSLLGMLGISRSKPMVVSVLPNTSTVKEDDVSRKDCPSSSASHSDTNGMSRRNPMVDSTIPSTLSAIEKDDPSRKDCAYFSANGSSTISPSVLVILPENPKNSVLTGKQVAPQNYSARAFTNSWSKFRKSHVSPVVADSPMNGWTESKPRQRELMVIPEEEEKLDHVDSPIRLSKLTCCLARVRKHMAERSIGDRHHRRKEMKVALILLVVNGTFVLCWLPHFVGALCLTFTKGSCPFPDNFFIVTTTLAMLNSGCNPFIYTLTYRKFRKAFKRVLPCFRRSSHPGNVNTPSH